MNALSKYTFFKYYSHNSCGHIISMKSYKKHGAHNFILSITMFLIFNPILRAETCKFKNINKLRKQLRKYKLHKNKLSYINQINGIKMFTRKVCRSIISYLCPELMLCTCMTSWVRTYNNFFSIIYAFLNRVYGTWYVSISNGEMWLLVCLVKLI